MKPTLGIFGIQNWHERRYADFVHDHSLAVMEGGEIKRYLQLERLTRVKHDNRMHSYIEELLESGQLGLPEDYDLVFVDSFVGRCFISTGGRVRFEAPLSDTLREDVEEGRCRVDGRIMKGYAINHELAHVHSCLPFYGPFREDSLLVHFDGAASLGNFSAWHHVEGRVRLIESHWSLSTVSRFFNRNALTFAILGAGRDEHVSTPGKLMGFAAYGKARPELLEWLRDNDYFQEIWNDKTRFFEEAESRFGWTERAFSTHDPFLQDIAATLQQEFVERTLAKMQELKARTGAEYLYFTGGCALSIVTNTRLLKSGLFRDVLVPPCCNDTGLSIGAACFLEQRKHGVVKPHTAYLNNVGLDGPEVEPSPELIREVAALLLARRVVGVCHGAGEVGPRALGNRSLLALADSVELRDRVSMGHKGREWYRPLAPIMLRAAAERLTGARSIPALARYMLMDFEILPEHRAAVQGVIHADGTSRIQVLERREDNPFMFDLLTFLDERHGVPGLINTSFNGRGEPIVHRPEDALASARRMGIDAVVIGNRLDVLEPGREDLAC